MKNVIASIQGRLKVVAQAEKKVYQLILTRYFQERLLFRIFLSVHGQNFCLKGGALLFALQRERSRPTLDIDLLGMRISNDQNTLLCVFREVCAVPYQEDGVTFDLDTLKASEITKEGNYNGTRIKIAANLGNIRQIMQIDIGFGDIITPAPVRMDYPTLLAMECPVVQAYSVETVIAEKFEAMIDLAELNSRMKDFYDLYRLLSGKSHDRAVLTDAIINTFTRRQTAYQAGHPVFSDAFARDTKRNGQWKAFLKKSFLDETIPFAEVMHVISSELLPIYRQLDNTGL